MSLRNIGIVYRKELTEALRDSRTLISSILIPLFLFPVLTVGIGYAFVEVADQASHEASKIMVLGGDDSPDVVQRLKDAKNFGEDEGEYGMFGRSREEKPKKLKMKVCSELEGIGVIQ